MTTPNLMQDISLRLYRQEPRTAEQQIEDRCSARAVAQDERRQGDAIQADHEAARRLFLELNPNEPLPELVGDGQLALTAPSTSGNAPLDSETSPSPGPTRSSEQPILPSSSSTFSQRPTLSSTSVKRPANHLDNVDEPSLGKQASKNADSATRLVSSRSAPFYSVLRLSLFVAVQRCKGSVWTPAFTLSTLASREYPRQDDHDISPAKRHKSSADGFPFGLGIAR
jgi:hypothetical protein